MDLRLKILKVSGEMFFKYGIRSVSIDDICNHIHISKKTFYVHFQQKDELIAEVLKMMREKNKKEHEKMLKGDNLLEQILYNFSKYNKQTWMEKHMAFFYDVEKYYTEIYQEHRKLVKTDKLGRTKEILNRGIEQGWFRGDIEIEPMSVLLSEAADSVIGKMRHIDMTNSQKAVFMMDVFMRIVASEKGLAYYLQKKQTKILD